MAEFNAKKDYYNILRVPEDATAEEIARVYRQQAGKRHPDRGGSEDDMKSLNEAYKVLSNNETRKAYDEKRGIEPHHEPHDHNEPRAHSSRPPHTSPAFDMESV